MRLALVEVYEVASFYAHFDIVMDGETPPPPLTVRVCDSLTCELFGAQNSGRAAGAGSAPRVRVVRAPCMGGCHNAPVAALGHALHEHARVGSIAGAVAAGETAPAVPPIAMLDAYRAHGGYRLLAACLARQDAREAILKRSRTRRCAASAAPASRPGANGAWCAPSRPRLMAVNADEGEPGTFKDRYYLETDPHRFFEGMLIGAWAVEAREIYIYLRDEYPQIREMLERRDREARSGGPRAPGEHPSAARRRRLYLRRGIGDARKHRGQARPAAPQAALSRRKSGCSAGRR